MGEVIIDLGKADWRYEPELGCHIPGCSQIKGELNARRCGNGPLIGDQIISGDCGEPHDLNAWMREALREALIAEFESPSVEQCVVCGDWHLSYVDHVCDFKNPYLRWFDTPHGLNMILDDLLYQER